MSVGKAQMEKEEMFCRSQTMIYTMLKVAFDVAKKDIMNKGNTMDEMAIIVLESLLSAIKKDS